MIKDGHTSRCLATMEPLEPRLLLSATLQTSSIVGAQGPVGSPAILTSWDPNEKVGPDGILPGLDYVAPDAKLSYTIYFENDPVLATAPAQVVNITDPLDADLDLSTFELTELAFGSHVITLPSGLNYYTTTVDLQPEGTDLLVEIGGEVDGCPGKPFTLYWHSERIP